MKAGTTADVYSVNATTSAKVATLGGGGSLGQAYGAIASQPGVVVPPGQSGWFQTIHIRGGDFDQVGYEFDGVPVLRSYDNYPTTPASTLGQQELQIYTGGAPANSESQGLAGYINQVIKSGTYPGLREPEPRDRLAHAVQQHAVRSRRRDAEPQLLVLRRVRQQLAELPLVRQQQRREHPDRSSARRSRVCRPPTAARSRPAIRTPGSQNSRVLLPRRCRPRRLRAWSARRQRQRRAGAGITRSILNLHFGLPHHNDSGKDDIQLLYDNTYLHNTYYSSATRLGASRATRCSPASTVDPAFGYLSGFGVGYQYLGASRANSARTSRTSGSRW